MVSFCGISVLKRQERESLGVSNDRPPRVIIDTLGLSQHFTVHPTAVPFPFYRGAH